MSSGDKRNHLAHEHEHTNIVVYDMKSVRNICRKNQDGYITSIIQWQWACIDIVGCNLY